MRTTLSSFSLEKSYCHPICVENYFLSPKMPVKDHSGAFRSTKTSFKPGKDLIDQVLSEQTQKARGILENVDINYTEKSQTLKKSLVALKDMNLLKTKDLHVIKHGGADKSLNSCIHTRQTNPGYSRNTLGGVYTK